LTEEQLIVAFCINRIEAEQDKDTKAIRVLIGKRPLDTFSSLDFDNGCMPLGAENIGRGVPWDSVLDKWTMSDAAEKPRAGGRAAGAGAGICALRNIIEIQI